MRRLVIPIFLLSVCNAFQANAQATVEQCNSQCYQTYEIRSNYCISRYGGSNYDSEICIMNEYEVLVDCLNNCQATYGGNSLSFISNLNNTDKNDAPKLLAIYNIAERDIQFDQIGNSFLSERVLSPEAVKSIRVRCRKSS